MAGGDDDKTEAPTPKRREQARSKGQVANSTEFSSALMLLAMIGSCLLLGDMIASASGRGVISSIKDASDLAGMDLAAGDFAGLMRTSIRGVAMSLAILLAPVIAVGFVVSYGQVGFRITPKAMGVDLQKINPVAGMKKIFGPRGAMRTLLGVLKIALIGTAVVIVVLSSGAELANVAGTDAPQVVSAAGTLFLRAVLTGTLVFFVLAIIDLVYQRYQHEKDMRMSRKEIKDEHKSSEGDPQVRARIRQLQREMAMNRMMQDVPDATVVVTNPTHYAVALRYEDGRDAAPTVVAKGLDNVALRIRELATESGVTIVEEPPLARALHRACDIGDAVPEDLFEAVAKVLAYVYRTEGRAVHA